MSPAGLKIGMHQKGAIESATKIRIYEDFKISAYRGTILCSARIKEERGEKRTVLRSLLSENSESVEFLLIVVGVRCRLFAFARTVSACGEI